MNLLQFYNRFQMPATKVSDLHEMNGYMNALKDVFKYLEQETRFDPARRRIDSVPLLEAISEANNMLIKRIDRIDKDAMLENSLNELKEFH